MQHNQQNRLQSLQHHPFVYTAVIMVLEACLSLSDPIPANAYPQKEIHVLAIIPHHFGANTFLNLHNFDKMGWHITTAGLTETVEPCAWFKSKTGVASFHVDLLIPDITDLSPYDIIVIMSATSSYGKYVYADLKDSPETLDLIREALNSGCLVWATCGGVRVLAAADVISSRSVVGSARFQDEYEAAGATFLGDDHPPVIDGPILTAVRGNYYHHQIARTMAHALENNWDTTGSYIAGRTLPAASSDLSWPDTTWSQSIGTEAADGAGDICALPSGHFLVTGYTWASENPDLMILSLDPSGAVDWAKSYGGPGWEYGNGICPSPDGGAVAVGYSTSFSTDDRDVFAVKIDPQGNEIWHKTYGGPALDVAASVCSSSSGGYAICGTTESEGEGEDDVYILRIDESGNTLWTRTFGGARSDMGSSVRETTDGGLIVSAGCGSEPYSAKNMDHCLIKLDSQGNISWWKTFNNPSGEGFDFTYSAIQTADGGYLLTGSSDTTVPMDFMQVKTDSCGEPEWSSIEGGVFYEYGFDICELQDGYLFAGVTEAPDDWQNNLFFLRTDLSGERIWTKTIGGPGQDWLSAVCPSGDGEVVAAGHTFSSETGNWNMLVCRIDAGGSAEPSVKIEMPSDYFTAGSMFQLDVRIWNPSVSTLKDFPLFILLDVMGTFYFWPSWTQNAEYRWIDLYPGAMSVEIIPGFIWPETAGQAEGIGFWAAMTTPEIDALFGNYDHVTFGWGG